MIDPVSDPAPRRATIVDFDQLAAVPCPCGTARRAFADVADFPATIHRTTIAGTAQTHYHRRLTETYYILDCEPGAVMELDGQQTPLKPGMCILIPPGVRHRAMGRLTILNIVLPKFDPSDEVVVDE
jgi:mannose-6-phosphate isomerase-like protein (cupin superfamily)